MKILIKFATRSRRAWFQASILNIMQTISPNADFLVLVTADSDDSDMADGSAAQFLSAQQVPHILCFGKSESKVHAINRDMQAADHFGWDMLVNMSDDMRFVVNAWDTVMVERIKDVWGGSTDFFAHFSDGYVHEKLPTMSIMGRAYYNRDGYIYHPSYKSFSCDAEAMYVAMMRQRHYYFPEVLFKHEHPAHGNVSNDGLYRINSMATEQDVKNYWSRLNNYFNEPVTPNTPIPFRQHLGKQPKGL